MCSLLSRYSTETISVGKQPLITAALIPPHGDSLFSVSALIRALAYYAIPFLPHATEVSTPMSGLLTSPMGVLSHLAQALTPCAGPQPHMEISLALVGL